MRGSPHHVSKGQEQFRNQVQTAATAGYVTIISNFNNKKKKARGLILSHDLKVRTKTEDSAMTFFFFLICCTTVRFTYRTVLDSALKLNCS